MDGDVGGRYSELEQYLARLKLQGFLYDDEDDTDNYKDFHRDYRSGTEAGDGENRENGERENIADFVGEIAKQKEAAAEVLRMMNEVDALDRRIYEIEEYDKMKQIQLKTLRKKYKAEELEAEAKRTGDKALHQRVPSLGGKGQQKQVTNENTTKEPNNNRFKKSSLLIPPFNSSSSLVSADDSTNPFFNDNPAATCSFESQSAFVTQQQILMNFRAREGRNNDSEDQSVSRTQDRTIPNAFLPSLGEALSLSKIELSLMKLQEGGFSLPKAFRGDTSLDKAAGGDDNMSLVMNMLSKELDGAKEERDESENIIKRAAEGKEKVVFLAKPQEEIQRLSLSSRSLPHVIAMLTRENVQYKRDEERKEGREYKPTLGEAFGLLEEKLNELDSKDGIGYNAGRTALADVGARWRSDTEVGIEMEGSDEVGVPEVVNISHMGKENDVVIRITDDEGNFMEETNMTDYYDDGTQQQSQEINGDSMDGGGRKVVSLPVSNIYRSASQRTKRKLRQLLEIVRLAAENIEIKGGSGEGDLFLEKETDEFLFGSEGEVFRPSSGANERPLLPVTVASVVAETQKKTFEDHATRMKDLFERVDAKDEGVGPMAEAAETLKSVEAARPNVANIFEVLSVPSIKTLARLRETTGQDRRAGSAAGESSHQGSSSPRDDGERSGRRSGLVEGLDSFNPSSSIAVAPVPQSHNTFLKKKYSLPEILSPSLSPSSSDILNQNKGTQQRKSSFLARKGKGSGLLAGDKTKQTEISAVLSVGQYGGVRLDSGMSDLKLDGKPI